MNVIRYNWENSEAHWVLLSKFVCQRNQEEFISADIWNRVLDEQALHAIERFVDEGLIALVGLERMLDYKYPVNELKNMLKQYGLSVAGRKADLINRLIFTDVSGMKNNVAGLKVYECTQAGKDLVEGHLFRKKEERILVEKQVEGFLKMRQFNDASLTVAAYEAKQVFSRGVGIDWKQYNAARDIETLNYIYKDKPRILANLPYDKFEELRKCTAMMMLWGTNTTDKWLSIDFETGLSFDADTASRMLLFYALHKLDIEEYRKSGIVEMVEILTTSDSCNTCKKLAKKKYRLSEAPELPYEHCTHEMGCRCTIAPVIE